MSGNERKLQIGEAAEQYSRLRGEQNHYADRLRKALIAYSYATQAMTNNQLTVRKGQIVTSSPSNRYAQVVQPGVEDLAHLLNYGELLHVVTEKSRLDQEVMAVRERLRSLAPHLL